MLRNIKLVMKVAYKSYDASGVHGVMQSASQHFCFVELKAISLGLLPVIILPEIRMNCLMKLGGQIRSQRLFKEVTRSNQFSGQAVDGGWNELGSSASRRNKYIS